MAMLEEKTLIAVGQLGINQIAGTLLCFITDPGVGRWRVWGAVRHTLADGILLRIAATGIISKIPNTPNVVTPFGPLIIDITGRTDDLAMDLVVATGAAETATGIIYAQRISQV